MALHKKCNQKREKSFYCIFMARTEQRALQKTQENEKFIVKMPLYDYRIHY